jgi:hypothetical protein
MNVVCINASCINETCINGFYGVRGGSANTAAEAASPAERDPNGRLAALVKFGTSVSPLVGAAVRKLVFRLAVSAVQCSAVA